MNFDVVMGEKCEMDVMNRESVIKMAIDHVAKDDRIRSNKRFGDDDSYAFVGEVVLKCIFRSDAQPIKGFYKAWKHVREIEGMVLNNPTIKAGCVLVLTNQNHYWNEESKKDSFMFPDFLLYKGRMVSDQTLVVNRANPGRSDVNETSHPDFYIRGEYKINWHEWPKSEETNLGKDFSYLALTIGV